jgi:hypothetical protein
MRTGKGIAKSLKEKAPLSENDFLREGAFSLIRGRD